MTVKRNPSGIRKSDCKTESVGDIRMSYTGSCVAEHAIMGGIRGRGKGQ